jgi:hypothetical protein
MRGRREHRNDVMHAAFGAIQTKDIPNGHTKVALISQALRRFQPSPFGGKNGKRNK